MSSVVSRDQKVRSHRIDGAKPSPLGRPQRNGRMRLVVAAVVLVALAGAATWPWWLPQARQSLLPAAAQVESPQADGHGAHAGHDHGAHGDTETLELSAQGRKNIGLELVTVKLSEFERTISIPATLAERPGRSVIAVSAPMTGIVTRVYPMRGEAVSRAIRCSIFA